MIFKFCAACHEAALTNNQDTAPHCYSKWVKDHLHDNDITALY